MSEKEVIKHFNVELLQKLPLDDEIFLEWQKKPTCVLWVVVKV